MKRHSAKGSGKSAFLPGNTTVKSGKPDSANLAQVGNRRHVVNPGDVDYYGAGTSQEDIMQGKDVYADDKLHSVVNPKK